MKPHFALITIGFAALLTHAVSADTIEQFEEKAVFQPSVFRTDNYSLAHLIQFPWRYKEGQDFNLSLACTAHITRRGRMEGAFCIGGNQETKEIEQSLLVATKRAKMVPARVNGKRKSVSLKFTTIFRRVNGEASVTVVPNHFVNHEKFGAKYSAPQLLTGVTKRYSVACRGMNLMMKINVNADGVASNARVHRSDLNTASCIKSVKNRISRLRYLPGTVDGIPTTMDHIYLVSWRGDFPSSLGVVIHRDTWY